MDALRILLCCSLLASFALGMSLKSSPAAPALPNPKGRVPVRPPRSNAPFHHRQKRSESCTVSSTLTATQKQEVVDVHNYLRDLEVSAGNMAEMVYDEGLASVAQEWAEQCIWAHGMTETCDGSNAGQNLHLYGNSSVAPALNVASALQGWYDEKVNYHFEDDSCDPGTMCGHYTQIVWDSSFKVGCGYAICDEVDTSIGVFYNAGYFACNYYDTGNFIGVLPYEDGERCNDCGSLFVGFSNGYKCNDNMRCEACDPDSDADCTAIGCFDEDPDCWLYDSDYCDATIYPGYEYYMTSYCRATCAFC